MIADPSIEAAFRNVLARMEVWLSYGSTVSLEPTTSHGERSYGRPPGDEHPPHVVWREKWLRASVLEHERLLREATEELAGLLERKVVVVAEETQVELEARMVQEGRGWDVKQVANHFNCTPTFVRRVRVAADVDVTNGEPFARRKLPKDARAERARELKAEGKTLRQIAMFLDCDAMTVKRDLASVLGVC